MAAANPRPLRVRCPYNDVYVQIPAIHVDDGDENEEDDDDDAMDEADDSRGTFAKATDHRRGGGGVFAASRTSELTLAFEGELYVFPAVTPEKVQAVLLLLGGCKLPTAGPVVDVPFDQSTRGVNDSPKRINLSRRIASLVRFREKRKERCFEKKIRYSVRKEVAQRMHRKNGQFVSVKVTGSSSLDSTKSGDQGDGKPRETVPCRCQHCGVGENSTPAMRRGPAGPRTLCNACGLIWANKGKLRDLRKAGTTFTLDQLEPVTPLDTKPPTKERENFSEDLDDHGVSEDPFKAITGPSSNLSINRDEEEDMMMYGFASVHSAMSSEIGAAVNSSSSRDFDEQGSFIEFAEDTSESDMGIIHARSFVI